MDTDSTDFIRNAIRHDSLCDAKGTYGRIACVECNIAELIVMTRYFPLLETRIVLRTMIFGAGVLAVLLVLACAGTAAGATWGAGDDGSADFASIQATVDAASAGDIIEVRSGMYVDLEVTKK
jgi:hypothetical protein